MREIWIILVLGLLSGAGLAQAVYKLDRVPICWVTPTAIDSSINRYSLISSRTGSQSTILHYTNANGGVVDVSAGGQFFIGYCADCVRDTLPVPRIEMFGVSQPIINPFNPTICGSTIAAYIYGVQYESQIELTVDAVPVSFNFDPITKYISSEVLYTSGSGVHNVVMTVTIPTGTAVKMGSFDCG